MDVFPIHTRVKLPHIVGVIQINPNWDLLVSEPHLIQPILVQVRTVPPAPATVHHAAEFYSFNI